MAREKTKSRTVVARVGDLPPGSSMAVEVRGREIAVFNVNGEFFAVGNRCPHEGAELCRGKIVGLVRSDRPGTYRLERHGELLRCPWHGWEFDIRTGQSWCDPKHTRARRFDVKVETGEELVKGPYVAETFPVAVEGKYVVIDM